MIRAVIAAGLLALSLVSCTSGNPTAKLGGGLVNPDVWVKNSHPVSSEVIQDFFGAEHCGAQNSNFLLLGWPLGHPAASVQVARWYVRNPQAFLGPELMSTFATGITLPRDARPTGYQNSTFELWLAASGQDVAAYVKFGGNFERWPRARQALLCE
jgi:hypothetical protein